MGGGNNQIIHFVIRGNKITHWNEMNWGKLKINNLELDEQNMYENKIKL